MGSIIQSTGKTPLDEKVYFAASVAHLFIGDVSNNQTQKDKANKILAETVFIANQTPWGTTAFPNTNVDATLAKIIEPAALANANIHANLAKSIESDIDIANLDLKGIIHTANTLSDIQKDAETVLAEYNGSDFEKVEPLKNDLNTFVKETSKDLLRFRQHLNKLKNHQSFLESQLTEIENTNNPTGYFITDKYSIAGLISGSKKVRKDTICHLETAIKQLTQDIVQAQYLFDKISDLKELENESIGESKALPKTGFFSKLLDIINPR